MKVLFIFGTRPEAIKLAPLIKACQLASEIKTSVCITGQHKEMLDQVLNFFQIIPDYDLKLMKANQTLFDITSAGLQGLKGVLESSKPDIILVQGDTTTAFIGALAGYYKQIKVAHIEAGLRSGNLYSPFPEEANRMLIGNLANYHFVPTHSAYQNLILENKTDHIYEVGNTVIDALLLGLEILKSRDENQLLEKFIKVNFSKRVILVTAHRRESFGEPFKNICNAIRKIAGSFTDVEIVFPVHHNPNVRDIVNEVLSGIQNVHLIEPLDYPEFIWLINKSYIILTDSGGVQEEAPSLGKPVLVMRETTERHEGIDAGTAKLVTTDALKIYDTAFSLLTNKQEYRSMANAVNPYGDGTSSKKIVEILSRNFYKA